MENLQNPENPINKTQKKSEPQKIAGILFVEAGIEFAFLIGGPLIAGIFAGKWLDAKTNHGFFVIIGILLGLLVSVIAIAKRTKDYKKILDNKLKK